MSKGILAPTAGHDHVHLPLGQYTTCINPSRDVLEQHRDLSRLVFLICGQARNRSLERLNLVLSLHDNFQNLVHVSRLNRRQWGRDSSRRCGPASLRAG